MRKIDELIKQLECLGSRYENLECWVWESEDEITIKINAPKTYKELIVNKNGCGKDVHIGCGVNIVCGINGLCRDCKDE